MGPLRVASGRRAPWYLHTGVPKAARFEQRAAEFLRLALQRRAALLSTFGSGGMYYLRCDPSRGALWWNFRWPIEASCGTVLSKRRASGASLASAEFLTRN